MSLQIVLTENAKLTLEVIFDFIDIKFGQKAADAFLFEVEKTLQMVSENPEMFRASVNSKKIRVGFISKQTSFYYEVNQQNLVVCYFWDNRQDSLGF